MDANNTVSSSSDQNDGCFSGKNSGISIKVENVADEDHPEKNHQDPEAVWSPTISIPIKTEPPDIPNCTIDFQVKEEPLEYQCEVETHSDHEELARRSCAAVYCEDEQLTPNYNNLNVAKPLTDQIEHCSVCRQVYTNKLDLIRHFQMAHGLKPTTENSKYKCLYCGHGSNTKKSYEQHIATHDGKKPYECYICHTGFKGEFNYKRHMAHGRCKKRPIYTCEYCPKSFDKKTLYKSHLRSHSEERNFVCDICQEAFKYRSSIVRHVRIHTGETTASCPICHKVFNHRDLVKPHMKFHSRDRPFGCPLCQKRFSMKHNAKKHLLTHAREKILSCWVCQKVFPKESRLKYHMQTHTKEKPYSCDICKKLFSHKQNVLRHLQRKHPETTTLYGRFR